MNAAAIWERVRSRDFLLEAAWLAGIFGTVTLLAFVVTTRLIVRSADSVVVEDLSGRDAGDAAVWLAARGLRAEIDHFESNDVAAPLSVTFHSPGPGEQVRPGHVIRLVISRGARNVPVPDVRNAYLSQASLILSRNALAVADVVEIHDEAPAGIVLATSPANNAQVLGGTPVRLLVSKGPAKRVWITPEVTWSSWDSVLELGEAMGVPIEVGQRMNAPDEPENVVLEQFPAPGARLEEGQSLRVTVNGDVAAPSPSSAGARLVEIRVATPRGFSMHLVSVRVIRDGWTRTLHEELVAPGERVRVIAAVLPGDRAVAEVDGRGVLVKRF